MINEEKQKALEAALGHIEKQYGKGSVMKLGDSSSNMVVEAVPTCRDKDRQCRREGKTDCR